MPPSHSAEDSVLIEHGAGLHGRPSIKLTKLAKSFRASVRMRVGDDGPWLDAKSPVAVMKAKAPAGNTLIFQAEGDDAEAAVMALTDLVKRNFGEHDAG